MRAAFDRVLGALLLVLVCRGCCPDEEPRRSAVLTGVYTVRDEGAAPLEELRLFIDGEAETVRFEYVVDDQEVIVDYEVIDRRFADEDG